MQCMIGNAASCGSKSLDPLGMGDGGSTETFGCHEAMKLSQPPKAFCNVCLVCMLCLKAGLCDYAMLLQGDHIYNYFNVLTSQ